MSQQSPRILLVALACLIFSAGPFPVTAARAASSPAGHDEDHPITMQRAAQSVATAPVSPTLRQAAPSSQTVKPNLATSGTRLNHEVFGFALASSLADPTIGYPSWDFSLLSTAAFFGLSVYDTGQFNNDSAMTVWKSTDAANFVSTAHAHGTRAVLTIILQDFSPGTPHMCNGLINRAATVSATVQMVNLRGADGVNVDYEGLNGSGCQNGQTPRSMMTDLVRQLRAALPGYYLSVDTYGSSAGDPSGFFDVPGMAASADSFFVMSYDMEYSNWHHQPPGCSSFCLGPTSPLTSYYYNGTDEMAQYTSVVPSSKVILGVPYYGRKSCVTTTAPNGVPQTDVIADTYQDALYDVYQQPGVATVRQERDANDPAGQEPWATWTNTSVCTMGNHVRELYWDDTTSLGLKYDLVNRDHLRGVGIWNLNFGGGQRELWDTLATHFTCTPPSNLAQSNGYNILTSFGGLYSFGSARYWGNLLDHQYPGPAVGLAETPTGCGYSILTSFGGIYSFGNAQYFGNLIDHGYPGPAVAVAMSPSGAGYAILTGFGGVYTFGDARYFGNLIDHGYPGQAVSMSYSPSGRGYVILTSTGAIYTFGDAGYFGNLLDHHYPGPATSVAYSSSGGGYDILNQAGALYTFGDGRYFGNLLDHGYPGPAVALSLTP